MQNSKVAILMATYNGEKFLHKQLDSIIQQNYQNWVLYILDDGSKDSTWEILQNYQTRYGAEKIKISRQENQGSTKTFLTLVCNPEIQADYYAYADQDDIWDVDKIECAVKSLVTQKNMRPALYCSAARLIDEDDKLIGEMPLQLSDISFNMALISNIAPGNTMVFNQFARDIVTKAGIVDVLVHDWWLYMAAVGCGGEIVADKTPHISYRQHSKNQIGFDHNNAKTSFGRTFKNYLKIFKTVINGHYLFYNISNIKALEKIKDFLTEENKKTLCYFHKSFTANRFLRIHYLKKTNLPHKTYIGTIIRNIIFIFI